MVKRQLTIVHLYHQNMNIYGDTGNVIAMMYRAQQRDISVDVVRCEVGEALPSKADIVIAGGGQDTGQLKVEKDLQRKKTTLRAWAEDGVVMLAICGMYQLFGHRFVTADQGEIKGIGLFDSETRGSKERLIGNVVAASDYGELVGFENHSGKTFLAESQASLGRVIKGGGNNGETGEEGAVRDNCFGAYLHGPVLPKNPQFADELLGRAIERKYGSRELLRALDDKHEYLAAAIAASRPR